jgi:hypothetical protein
MGMKTIGRFVFDSTTAATLDANQNISLPTSTVSTNCISCDGTNITINRCGTYQISADFSFAATAVAAIETQMYRNGNAVPGAHALDTATAVGNLTSQSFNALVTVPRNAVGTVLNFKALDATSVRVANVIVTKVA